MPPVVVNKFIFRKYLQQFALECESKALKRFLRIQLNDVLCISVNVCQMDSGQGDAFEFVHSNFEEVSLPEQQKDRLNLLLSLGEKLMFNEIRFILDLA